MSAAVGLLAAACQTAPQTPAPTGVIAGKVKPLNMVRSVRAVSDDGRKHRAKVHADGSFRFKPLPYGSYSLKFLGDCENRDAGRVILEESEHTVGAPADMQECIIIGMAKIEDNRA